MSTVIYYIFKDELSFDLIKKYYHNLYAIIEVVFINNKVIIKNFKSNIPTYGTYLLTHVYDEATKRNIEFIDLDDCSDRYRQTHNIYTKFGIKYIEEERPEMRGNIKDLSIYIKKFSYKPNIYEYLILSF